MKTRIVACIVAVGMALQMLSIPVFALHSFGAQQLAHARVEGEAAAVELQSDGWRGAEVYQSIQTSYGLDMDLFSGRLFEYGTQFNLEFTPLAEKDVGWMAYWYDGFAFAENYEEVAQSGGTLFIPLLNGSIAPPWLARVPDKEFDGFYVYTKFAQHPGSSGMWRWDETCQSLMIPAPGHTDVDTWYNQVVALTGEDSDVPVGTEDYTTLPLVAKWKPSAKAGLRGAAGDFLFSAKTADGTVRPVTTFYTGDTVGKTAAQLEAMEITFDPSVKDYYLRVDSGVEKVDLTLTAIEPYYQFFTNQGTFTAANSPVKASVAFGGGEPLDLTETFLSAGNAKMMPVAGQTRGNNSVENPARSVWQLKDVPIERSAGEGKQHNVIVITVTAPDGVTKEEYTFRIQRLTEPKMTLNPGNSPFGMIARDTSEFWGEGTELKDQAKAHFTDYNSFDFVGNLYPRDAANNNGNVTQKTYTPGAWRTAGVNYDRDPNAIVVYLDSAFLDPGIAALTDTQGNPVNLYDGSVKRMIQLRTAPKLTIDLLHETAGDIVYYQSGAVPTLSQSKVIESLDTPDTPNLVDLRGLNVLPGIYTIEYILDDEVTEGTYDSAGDAFVTQKDNAKLFQRTLIVLPIPGDMDMDGMVTPADVTALRTLGGLSGTTTVTTKLGSRAAGTDRVVDLMLYRVADVSANGIIGTDSDIPMLQAGYLPRMTRNDGSDYYYIPLPDGGAGYDRRNILDAQPVQDAGDLTLYFMGEERGVKSENGSYHSVTGPKYTDALNGTITDGIQLGDTFWMGVYLSNADQNQLLGSSVSGFTMTLTYNSEFVEPASVLQTTQLPSAGEPWWRSTWQIYNFGEIGRTIWGTNYRYELAANANPAREYLTHYTKAITSLEEKNPSLTNLRELVFSVQHSRDNVAALRDGWLLVVPFTLKKFPTGTEQRPVLIEMGAGMREFVLIGTGSGVAGDPAAGGLMGAAPAAGSVPFTAAYSVQESIYGSVTENLRASVKYNQQQGILLGADDTPPIILPDAVYGQQYTSGYVFSGVLRDGDSIPKGLKFSSGTSYSIIGIPEEAGTYVFHIDEFRYQLTVKKAEIRFYADNHYSYYGQGEVRGDGRTDFTYSYYPGDINALDIARVGGGVVNDGNGTSLFALLGGASGEYTPPKFRAMNVGGLTVVTKNTPVGTYPIQCPQEYLPTAKNYTFKYVLEDAPSNGNDMGQLFIRPRPVRVEKLVVAPGSILGEIYDNNEGFLSRTATLDPATQQIALMLPEVTGGLYNSYPLTGAALVTGDHLEFSYTARFIRTAEDNEVGPVGRYFKVPSGESVLRDIEASQFRLVDQFSSANYRLINNSALTSIVVDGGKVWARQISALELTKVPAMSYVYGEGFDTSAINFIIHYEGNSSTNVLQFSFPMGENAVGTEESYGVHFGWVSADLANKPVWTEADTAQVIPLSTNVQLGVALSGKYLCAWAETKDRDGVTHIVHIAADKPVVIERKEVLLTAGKMERYYGEGNAEILTFQYRVSDLLLSDRLQNAKGLGTELTGTPGSPGYLAGYVAPTLKAALNKNGTGTVSERTPVGNAYIVIEGAQAENYQFVYAKSDSTPDTVRGYAQLTILPRPIVVTKINSSTSGKTELGRVTIPGVGTEVVNSHHENPTGITLATVYADTKTMTVDTGTASADCKYNGSVLAPGEFEVALPDHTATTTTYYAGTVGTIQSRPIGYSNETAILPEDTVELSYRATFVPEKANHYGLADSHFDTTPMDPDTGRRVCDVQVSNIALTGAHAGNYVLVYKNENSARNRMPNVWQAVWAPNANGSDTNKGTYYVSGHGILETRPITDIEIVAAPLLTYDYGDQFAPMLPDTGSTAPMTIQVVYDTKYDNDLGRNNTTELLRFEVLMGETMDDLVTNFSLRGMKILYLHGTDKSQAQELKPAEYVSVGLHNGAHLLVSGRRSERDELVYSQLTKRTLVIHKKQLPVTVEHQYRYYGENNTHYSYTFKTADLALPDRAYLGGNTIGRGQATSTGASIAKPGTAGAAATTSDLTAIPDSGYVAPIFYSDAVARSDVLEDGKGSYPLTLEGGSMANYELVPTAGAIHVYRRPIRVTGVNSDAQNPIYGIYSDTKEVIFNTNVRSDKLVTALPNLSGGLYTNYNDPEFIKIPMPQGRALTGSGVLPGDDLSFLLRVEFEPFTMPPEGESVSVATHVTDVTLNRASPAGKNYILTPSSYNLPAIGEAELRNIESIELFLPPKNMTYNYPNALSLDGLEVKINYAKSEAESGTKSANVQYIGAAQFASYGLYVRYNGDTPQLPQAGANAQLKALFDRRQAETGDHLTIAPTHDAQLRGDTFAANGNYLAIVAQRHEAQDFSNAILAADVPITVKPLPIQFTLSAADKTYDGNTQAVGTLTMQNIFRAGNAVDAHHKDGITDIVFVQTGDASETPADPLRYDSYSALRTRIDSEGYVFTSGHYRRNEGDRLRDHLEFTGGVYGAGMTFSFLDPNVSYLSPPSHDSYGELAKAAVEVTGLVLGGPDAANYTMVASVEGDTLAAARAGGYQGSALPQATIRKAARADLTTLLGDTPDASILPSIELDSNSNTVRMKYTVPVGRFLPAIDVLTDGYHLEYALQYDNSTSDAPAVGRWAGAQGSNTYQDTTFFGGEFAAVDITPGYVANASKAPAEFNPEKDILRGQPYPWLEDDDGVEYYLPAYLRVQLPDGSLSEAPYAGYEVFSTSRAPLPRDTVFWGMVRLAETHNYEASPALSSVSDVTHAAITAEERGDEGAAAALLAAARGADTAARSVAAAYAAQYEEIAISGRWPQEGIDVPGAAPAVKTFRQRIDLISETTERALGGGEDISIPVLEAVHFTDFVDYPERRLFEAVVRNLTPLRYYGYYWDKEFTVALELDNRSQPFSLAQPFTVEIRASGQPAPTLLIVNEGNTAQIYVDLQPPSGDELRALHIRPAQVVAEIGDAPMQLVVEFNPSTNKRKTVRWDSSDTSVVTVDAFGLLTFVGVGSATITATAYNDMTDTIPVTVVESWAHGMQTTYPNSIFHFGNRTPYFGVDADLRFYPMLEMTRGELVMVIAQFYRQNENWTRSGSGEFPDLTGDEPYAAAAKLLGELGVITGVEGGRFAGRQIVTRAELMAILARMLYMDPPDTTGRPHAFVDAGEGDTWAYSYIDTMYQLGIVDGVGGGYFAPDRALTRAEVAAVLDRMLRRWVDPTAPGVMVPSDAGEAAWAFNAIVNAVNTKLKTESLQEVLQ